LFVPEEELSMCPLRRVDDDRAGPAALGVLVPPGRRTFLILRPRSLAWDLVLLRGAEGKAFRDMNRDEAQVVAGALLRALDKAGGHVEEVAHPDGRLWLRARVGPYALLVCPRLPGQPYQPEAFPDAASARAAAAELAPILCPPPGVEQECYCNTRHFSP
jgi:hypothetical protein